MPRDLRIDTGASGGPRSTVARICEYAGVAGRGLTCSLPRSFERQPVPPDDVIFEFEAKTLDQVFIW